MNIFKLNRYFWDYAFNNPEKIKPNHCAIYYFALEHSNRLGWKEKFGFPTSMVLEATGIKSYSVYKKTFDELVSFGFFEVIEYSKNQYSSNIIALKENYKAPNKALDKALIKHSTKQSESIVQSIDSIDKQETNKQLTIQPIKKDISTRKREFYNSLIPFLDFYSKEMLKDFFEYWSEHGEKDKKFRKEKEKSFNLELRLKTWFKRSKEFKEKNVAPKKEKSLMLTDKMKQDYGIE